MPLRPLRKHSVRPILSMIDSCYRAGGAVKFNGVDFAPARLISPTGASNFKGGVDRFCRFVHFRRNKKGERKFAFFILFFGAATRRRAHGRPMWEIDMKSRGGRTKNGRMRMRQTVQSRIQGLMAEKLRVPTAYSSSLGLVSFLERSRTKPPASIERRMRENAHTM